MALGVIASGVETPLDLSSALLRDHIGGVHPWFVRLGAILGLGFAYANSKKDVVTGKDGIVVSLKGVGRFGDLRCMRFILKSPPIQIIEKEWEIVLAREYAALSLGFILIGTVDVTVTQMLLTLLDTTIVRRRQVCLAIGLLYFGRWLIVKRV